MSVDGTDYRINKPKPFSKKWFSHKFKGAGLRYEVAVAIQSGHIVWTNGPFPAGTPDLKIFRQDFKKVLKNGERVEADKGYRGEPTNIDLPQENTGGCTTQMLVKKRVRARHETVNARFKEWGVLKNRFRHKISRHHSVFRAIVVITQLKIENGHPLFQVEYTTFAHKPIIVENSSDDDIDFSENESETSDSDN